MKIILSILSIFLFFISGKDSESGIPDNDIIIWSDSTKLTWQDYQGLPTNKNYSAGTTYKLKADCRCLDGEWAEIKVYAVF